MTGDGDQAAAVYGAWKATTDQHVADGHGPSHAVMIAGSNDTVTQLNRRARADRITAGAVDQTRQVALASGLHASPGDVIVTRQNNRRLPVTTTDFVKNGDRWTVQDVHPTGGISVRHEQLGRVITLPADYVAQHVDLGYAATVHGVQGQTVRSSFLLARGQETRQLLYVAMSRGTHENVVFVPMGTDGDPHGQLLPDRVVPPTAVEFLEKIIARDGSQVAATTERAAQHDPALLLGRAVARYSDGVQFAVTTLVGGQRMTELTDGATTVLPGLSDSPAWGTLAAHLATLDLSGTDPITALRAAITSRELGTADDVCAVLDWRLDPAGTHSAGTGPLPGLPGIPATITGREELGTWLSERADLVTHCAQQLRASTAQWGPDTAPAWARDLLEHPDLVGDLAIWRAIHAVPEQDPTPTGRPHPCPARRVRQRALGTWAQNVTGEHAAPGTAFTATLTEHTPAVLNDPWWPILGRHLDHAAAAGRPVADYLTDALQLGPLPDDYPAAALWSRLSQRLQPAAATTGHHTSGSTRLRPTWARAMTAALPRGTGARVMADPAWPTLVASVHHASAACGLAPQDIITRAIDLIGADHLPHLPGDDSGDSTGITNPDRPVRMPLAALATVLSMRVGDLTYTPPAVDDAPITEHDLYDGDLEDFLTRTAGENDTEPATEQHAPPAQDPPQEDPLQEDPLVPTPEPEEEEEEELVEPRTSPQRVLELTAQAGAFYAAAYPGSASATYLTSRFGTDLSETPFMVGHAGTDRTDLLRHLHATAQATAKEVVDAGLARWGKHGAYDFFRDRALIGIHDQDGQLIGFNGRALNQDQRGPKYLNTPTTSVFRKGAALFGLYEGLQGAPIARPDVIGVEGPMDAIAATLAGDGTAIGIASGTGGFTTAQVEQLATYAANTTERTLWLAKDRDAAGQRALVKDNAAFAARGITARALLIFGGKDLAEMHHADPEAARANLATRDLAPPAARQIVADLAHTHHASNQDNNAYHQVWVVKRMAETLAALPSRQWATEIDEATLLFGDGKEERDHYAHLLYIETLHRAMHWDPTGTCPTADQDVLTATNDLARAVEQVTGPVSRRARQAQRAAMRTITEGIEEMARRHTAAQAAEKKLTKTQKAGVNPSRAGTDRMDSPPIATTPARTGTSHATADQPANEHRTPGRPRHASDRWTKCLRRLGSGPTSRARCPSGHRRNGIRCGMPFACCVQMSLAASPVCGFGLLTMRAWRWWR